MQIKEKRQMYRDSTKSLENNIMKHEILRQRSEKSTNAEDELNQNTSTVLFLKEQSKSNVKRKSKSRRGFGCFGKSKTLDDDTSIDVDREMRDNDQPKRSIESVDSVRKPNDTKKSNKSNSITKSDNSTGDRISVEDKPGAIIANPSTKNQEDGPLNQADISRQNSNTLCHADSFNIKVNQTDQPKSIPPTYRIRTRSEVKQSVKDLIGQNDKEQLEKWRKIILSLDDESLLFESIKSVKNCYSYDFTPSTPYYVPADIESRQPVHTIFEKCHDHCLPYFTNCNRPCFSAEPYQHLIVGGAHPLNFIDQDEINRRLTEQRNRNRDPFSETGNSEGFGKFLQPYRTSRWKEFHALQSALIFK